VPRAGSNSLQKVDTAPTRARRSWRRQPIDSDHRLVRERPLGGGARPGRARLRRTLYRRWPYDAVTDNLEVVAPRRPSFATGRRWSRAASTRARRSRRTRTSSTRPISSLRSTGVPLWAEYLARPRLARGHVGGDETEEHPADRAGWLGRLRLAAEPAEELWSIAAGCCTATETSVSSCHDATVAGVVTALEELVPQLRAGLARCADLARRARADLRQTRQERRSPCGRGRRSCAVAPRGA
jgi:hypothetical protein